MNADLGPRLSLAHRFPPVAVIAKLEASVEMESLGWGNPTASSWNLSSACCDEFGGMTAAGRLDGLGSTFLGPGDGGVGLGQGIGTAAVDAVRLNCQSELIQSSSLWSAADEDLILSQACAPFPAVAADECCSLIEDLGAASDELLVIGGGNNDDDVISAIFSGSENFCNLSCSGNASTGESENHDAASKVSLSWIDLDTAAKRKAEECRSALLRSNPSPLKEEEEEGIRAVDSRSRHRLKKLRPSESTSTISFSRESGGGAHYEPDTEVIAQVKEMIYRAAALRPVTPGAEEAVERPKRKNVKISSDPQTVAARHRRERISERLRVLQRLVPGGSKLDTATMLDEAANYLKFLKSQVRALETLGGATSGGNSSRHTDPTSNYFNTSPSPMQPFPLALNQQAFTVQRLYPAQKP